MVEASVRLLANQPRAALVFRSISDRDEMFARAEEARKLLEKVQAANEAAWSDMRSASQKALVELQRGWEDALSRFNK